MNEPSETSRVIFHKDHCAGMSIVSCRAHDPDSGAARCIIGEDDPLTVGESYGA